MPQSNEGNVIRTTDPFWQGPSVGSHEEAAYAGTFTVDFSGSAYQSITLSGDIHFIVANMAGSNNLHGVSLRMIGDGTDRTVGYDTDIQWLGSAPQTLPADKTAVASFTSYGNLATDVIAVFAKTL